MARCTHLNTIPIVKPSSEGCEEYLKMNDTWLHLRPVPHLRSVGCCDQSKNRHATEHCRATSHPIIEGWDPPEGWG